MVLFTAAGIFVQCKFTAKGTDGSNLPAGNADGKLHDLV